MSTGIGAIELSLPTDFVAIDKLPELGEAPAETRDFLARSGIAQVGVLPGQECVPPAIEVTRRLLERTGTEPDVLILVSSRAPDLLLASDATAVQAAAVPTARLAFSLDGLGCTGSSAAWGLASALLMADPSVEEVVVTHASRPIGLDRVRPPVTVVGDGACAMTLRRHARPALVGHAVAVDGQYHDVFAVDYKEKPWWEWEEVCQSDRKYRFELAVRSAQTLRKLIDEACGQAGRDPSRIRHTLMQNVTTGSFDFYESALGLTIHPTCRSMLQRYGHLGAMDVIANLDQLLNSADAAPGDLVLVLNNSSVAAWAATLWEI